MSIFKYLAACSVLAIGINITVKAQYIPGTVDMMPSINATTTNAITEARTRILSGNSSATSAAERRGAQRIKAGKASLEFTPTYAGTVALVKDMDFYPESPQDVPGQVKMIQAYVGQFNQLMTKAGYKVNNVTDGLIFSYALAYVVYYGEKPDAVTLNQWRQSWSEESLRDAHFQSLPDSIKQYRYEDRAFMAMQAVEEKIKFKTAKTKQEKELLNERAMAHAKYILDLIK